MDFFVMSVLRCGLEQGKEGGDCPDQERPASVMCCTCTVLTTSVRETRLSEGAFQRLAHAKLMLKQSN
jgi:hypothetical protein